MKKIFIPLFVVVLFACNNEQKTDTDTKVASSNSDSSAKKPASEFADPKYVDLGKAQLAKFESGDIDGWLNGFADNAVWNWSSGDSLAGKAKIAEYWKNRRANVIDSVKFSNDIWLPLKVNTPQKGPDMPGIWLLNWYMVNVKYKNGKKLMFWIHADYHFDSNDKIDRAIEYIDRAPINAALA